MSIDPKTFHHAPAGSVHGQLQRGRGAGYLAALELPRDEAHRLLIDCITCDPRIDSQVEQRTEYYASLAHQLGLPLDALEHHLATHDDPKQNCWITLLTIEVLGSLARRGSSDAGKILRGYIEWGSSWADAVRELGASADPTLWNGLDKVICSLFPNANLLENALGWFNDDNPAWISWGKSNPTIATLIERDRNRRLLVQREQREAGGTDLSVSELLATANDKNVWLFRRAIKAKVQPADAKVLLENLSPERPFVAGVALAGLELLAQAEFFEPLLAFWKVCPEKPRWLRGHCRHAVAALPLNAVYQLGRNWLKSTDRWERWIAEEILKNQANVEDVPLLQTAIRECFQDDFKNLYRLCSLLEAFQRLPNFGLVPELETAFVECRYSYARKRSAQAMSICSPQDFIQRYSRECLWDCESGDRELACQFVALNDPQCRTRLEELSRDGTEEEHVQKAAKARLNKGDEQ
ncbi:hypothetical protein GC207_02955 [bacterium]|nr:hypothetical protein [bacterium]